MTLEKLPTVSQGRWWGTQERVSSRLHVEVAAVRTFFDAEHPTDLALPHSDWDVQRIRVITHKRNLHREETNTEYDLWWDVLFSMNDGGRLVSAKDRWNMWILYPNRYPFVAPHIAYPGFHLGSVEGMNHTSNSFNFRGGTYRRICHFGHGSSDYRIGHDPAKTNTVMHAIRAILWLRSRINAQHERGEMYEYGGK